MSHCALIELYSIKFKEFKATDHENEELQVKENDREVVIKEIPFYFSQRIRFRLSCQQAKIVSTTSLAVKGENNMLANALQFRLGM